MAGFVLLISPLAVFVSELAVLGRTRSATRNGWAAVTCGVLFTAVLVKLNSTIPGLGRTGWETLYRTDLVTGQRGQGVHHAPELVVAGLAGLFVVGLLHLFWSLRPSEQRAQVVPTRTAAGLGLLCAIGSEVLLFGFFIE